MFRGECFFCKQVGHPAAECPNKAADKCYNCKEEGHEAKDCKNNRVFDSADIEEVTADEAWAKLVDADQSEDLDDVRYVSLLSLSVPERVTADYLTRHSRSTARLLQKLLTKSLSRVFVRTTSIPI